jgi:drug/metabolite transporter (DMT)-like permease
VCLAGGAPAAPAVAPELGVAGTLVLLLPFFLWGTSMVGARAAVCRARRVSSSRAPLPPPLPPPRQVALKVVLPATSPLFVAAVRLLPSGLALVLFASLRGRPQPSGAPAWAAVALFGLVDGTLFQGCLAEGLQRTSAGLGSVIIDSQPLTVALLAAWLFGERVSPLAAVGLLMGLAGLLVLELPAGGSGGAGARELLAASFASGPALWERGEWWMLLAAQAMAVGTVMSRYVMGMGVDSVMATGWHMVLGGAPLLALSLAREPELYARLAADGLPAADVALLGYASLLGGALAYAAYFNAAATGSLVRLSSLTFLTPVFAAGAGFLALGETLTAQQLAGAAITLAGITLVTRRQDTAAAAGEEEKA